MPPALAELGRLGSEVHEDSDLEMYDAFAPPRETAAWLAKWTGQEDADASALRLFGEDGTGGRFGIWLTREGEPLEAQPVVFFSSEGELGVVGRDLGDYLVLLGRGVSPFDIVEGCFDAGEPRPGICALAERYFPAAVRRTSKEAVAATRALTRALKKVFAG